MKKQRQALPWLLLAAMLLSFLSPRPTMAADAPPTLTDFFITTEARDGGDGLQSGVTVDAGAREVRLTFSQSLIPTTVLAPGNVTLRDSQGNDPGWRLEAYSFIALVNTTYKSLTPGETYTIRVKGGPDGVQFENGARLPEDLTVTFKTVQGPFTLKEIQMFTDSGMTPTTELSTALARNVNEIRVEWNRALGGASVAGAITVRDSQGRDPGWKVGAESNGGFYFYYPLLPAKNETYTVTVKGGPDGLKSELGQTLPADVTLTFKTGDEPVSNHVYLITDARQYGVLQSDVYRVQASKGKLNVGIPFGAGEWSKVMLEDAQTHELLMDEMLAANGKVNADVDLPHDGVYNLLVAPDHGSVTVSGLDVVASTEMPLLKLPAMRAYETHNTPFTIQPELVDPTVAKSVQASLNGKVLNENALQPDGKIAPVSIDPQQLPDGLYRFGVMAEGKSSGNQAINARTFLVDRESSFPDVAADHWARRFVEIMHHLGIINGRDTGLFAPGEPVKRAEFAKMLALTLHLKPKSDAPSRFADVPDNWAKPHIEALADAGLVQGETVDGKAYFYPDRTITRAEAATILGRALGVATVDVSGKSVSFTDGAQIPKWALPSVVALTQMKWLSGFPDGTFGPFQSLNRDQAAKILSGFLGVQ